MDRRSFLGFLGLAPLASKINLTPLDRSPTLPLPVKRIIPTFPSVKVPWPDANNLRLGHFTMYPGVWLIKNGEDTMPLDKEIKLRFLGQQVMSTHCPDRNGQVFFYPPGSKGFEYCVKNQGLHDGEWCRTGIYCLWYHRKYGRVRNFMSFRQKDNIFAMMSVRQGQRVTLGVDTIKYKKSEYYLPRVIV